MNSSLKLLREYLRLILITEDKVRDLAKQNPNVNVYVLADFDVSPTKKLLPWMIKQVSRGAHEEEVKSVVSRFFEYEAMLPNKDINSYSKIDDLKSAIDALGPSKRSHLIQIKSGAVKIFEDKNDLVLRIDTKEAAQQYGKGTKWCITMQDKHYYEEYVENNVLFYYVLKKREKGDPTLQKVALAVIRTDNNSVREIQAFDQVDTQMTPEDAYVSEQALEAVKLDVKKQPQTMSAKIRTGAFTTDDIKQAWGSLSTELQKIQFLINAERKAHNLNGILDTIKNIETDPDIREIIHDLMYDKASVEDDKICWYAPDYPEYHREGDKPAVINRTGTKIWYKNGLLHRENDKPAAILADGSMYWWVKGKRHRDGNKPARINADGTKEYFKNGVRYEPSEKNL
jgi:hypothetical protein